MVPDGALNFRKSSFSGSGDNCVEVGGAAVRDSQNPEHGHLRFPSSGEWRAFLAAARRDRL